MKKLLLYISMIMPLSAHSMSIESINDDNISDIKLLSELKGHDSHNGGDTSCEREIVRISQTIVNWLHEDGPEYLDYSERTDLNPQTFKKRMLNAFSSDTVVSCTNNQDLVKVGDSEKSCINFKDKGNTGKSRILCHRGTFTNLIEKDKLYDIFHEGAGLAEIEINDGAEKSNYYFTNQISENYSEVLVGKIALKKSSSYSFADDWSLQEVMSNGYKIGLKPKSYIRALRFTKDNDFTFKGSTEFDNCSLKLTFFTDYKGEVSFPNEMITLFNIYTDTRNNKITIASDLHNWLSKSKGGYHINSQVFAHFKTTDKKNTFKEFKRLCSKFDVHLLN